MPGERENEVERERVETGKSRCGLGQEWGQRQTEDGERLVPFIHSRIYEWPISTVPTEREGGREGGRGEGGRAGVRDGACTMHRYKRLVSMARAL